MANIVYWSLIKYKRVTKSVLASKFYKIVHDFDIAIIITSIVNKILQINLLPILCTNSKTLYNCLVRLGTT